MVSDQTPAPGPNARIKIQLCDKECKRNVPARSSPRRP